MAAASDFPTLDELDQKWLVCADDQATFKMVAGAVMRNVAREIRQWFFLSSWTVKVGQHEINEKMNFCFYLPTAVESIKKLIEDEIAQKGFVVSVQYVVAQYSRAFVVTVSRPDPSDFR